MMREKIIQDCIDSIKEFGYPNVNRDNIFTDKIYSRFFKNILEDNLGKNDFVDCALLDLLNKVQQINDIEEI